MDSCVLVAARPGRPPRIEYRGALAVRCTGPDTVHLVSAAATPLGGDTVAIRLIVPPGTRLRVHSVAATIALPGPAVSTSWSRWDIEAGGDLLVDPEPTVVASTARHVTECRLQLADDARIRLRERVQIGRVGERTGYWSGRLHADLGTRPLLRHLLELGPGAVANDVLAAPSACVSELHYPDPGIDVPGTTLALAAGGSLSTWQGDRLG